MIELIGQIPIVKNTLKNTIDYVKENPLTNLFLPSALIGALGLTSYMASNRSDTQSTPTQENWFGEQSVDTTQQAKSKSKDFSDLPPLAQVVGSNNTQAIGGVVSSNNVGQQDEMSRFLQIISTINEDVQKHAQVFELATQKYIEANQEYGNKLNEVLPVIALFSAKTSFRDLTKEDLPRHIGDYLKNVAYGVGINSVNKLIKGYYVLRLNGVDTEELSPVDIIQAGENPAFVENLHEEVVKNLNQIGGILQLKIKQNLDTIGVMKDNYKAIRDELLKKAELYEKIFKFATDYIFKEKNLQLHYEKLQEQIRHNKATEGLRKESLQLQRERLNQKQDDNNILNITPVSPDKF